MAAVLACGPGAVLSHASAAALWGIRFSDSVYIDVTVRRTGRRARGRIHVHRPRALPPSEVTPRHRIPVPTTAPTAHDVAARLTESRLESLLGKVERRPPATEPCASPTANSR